MDAQVAKSGPHPLIIIAAVAVTLFSVAGIGAIMGWFPSSTGTPAPQVVSNAPQAAEKPKAAAPKPKPVAKVEKPAQVAAVTPPPPPPAPVRMICKDCGVIAEVNEIKKAGQGSGAGAVGGAVVGGVIGHQVGAGRGKDLATVLGAVGGGLAGHAIEKNAKSSVEYRIVIRFEDGTTQQFTQPTPPAWRIGDKVRVINDTIQSNG